MLTAHVGRVADQVIWIRVDKPSLDIVGLILGSVLATAVLALGALLLGFGIGLLLIRYRRRAGVFNKHAIITLNIPEQ
jgi:hypothetical protein